MRITGGEWRSRRLKGPGRGSAIRPTPDALRERVFAVLGERILDARLLDLFAGTGAVGLEALSRGASRVILVDHHPAAAKLIAANRSALCDDDARSQFIQMPAAAAIAALARRRETFDIVWADPPFEAWREGLEVLIDAFEAGVIQADGLACLECPDRANVATELPRWLVIQRDLGGGASRVVVLARIPGE